MISSIPTAIFFAFDNGFSGTNNIDALYYTLYEVINTEIVIFTFLWLDQDISAKTWKAGHSVAFIENK